MFIMRKAPRGAAVVVAAAVGMVVGAGGGAGAVAPEADVAYHGYASLRDGRLDILVLARNHGPAAPADTTVRVTVSAPLAAPGHTLPPGCLWGGDREVLCATGALPADGTLRERRLALRTAGTPHEVTVRVETAWNGGVTDRDPADNRHQVLVPATGDPYVF
ncbi:hypothetical protein I3F58_17825 [Streptomyces sp. MUM 203J]|uniref:hypothetical protein n=1 Tax=Streptomyces sp. MUM 203J TaxID=2791990 RepID=UPI001F03512C|nr:hypothetical protein [Streptomyces sp. MUM 203J]MCH0541385.1 hypothetical protein [Streptomyces sp. MUM 203J]